MLRLVIDGPTMRVMYYTNDLKQDLNLVEGTLLYDYHGSKPTEMELSNCWNWKLVGNKLVNTEAKVPNVPESLLEHNKKETRKLLIEKINLARKSLLSDYVGGDVVRVLKTTDTDFIKMLASAAGVAEDAYLNNVNAAKQVNEEKLKNTELNKEYYTKRITDSLSNEDLFAVRDEFANTDLKEFNR